MIHQPPFACETAVSGPMSVFLPVSSWVVGCPHPHHLPHPASRRNEGCRSCSIITGSLQTAFSPARWMRPWAGELLLHLRGRAPSDDRSETRAHSQRIKQIILFLFTFQTDPQLSDSGSTAARSWITVPATDPSAAGMKKVSFLVLFTAGVAGISAWRGWLELIRLHCCIGHPPVEFILMVWMFWKGHSLPECAVGSDASMLSWRRPDSLVHLWMSNSGLDSTQPVKIVFQNIFLSGNSRCVLVCQTYSYFHPRLQKGAKMFQFQTDLSSIKWILVELLQMRRRSSPSSGFLCSDCIKTVTSVVPPVVSLPWEAELWYYMILACKIWVKPSIILGFALSFSQFPV